MISFGLAFSKFYALIYSYSFTVLYYWQSRGGGSKRKI